jgi:bifunctional non-homologous end joining protein LigD
MSLATYNKKRNFKKTPEPTGGKAHKGKKLIFVVQKHDASHLHYDFRLEMEGVLKSWAVPKGPSLDPSVKRLAMEVEDHPWSYRSFEGKIPEGNYGAGDVIVWDTGTYEGEDGEEGLLQGLKKGHLSFIMHGKKLQGEWSLVRTRSDKSGRARWLLVKKDDEYATDEDVTRQVNSVLSKRILPRDRGEAEESVETNKPTKRHKNRLTARDLKPMLATLTDAPFDDPDWVFEVKWDGYRVITKIENGTVTLYSRNGLDVTEKYQTLAEAAAKIDHNAVIDGELVALDSKGKPSFSLMQKASENPSALVYYAFDILALDGEDLRDKPLLQRKEVLKEILPKKGVIRYSDHIEKQGKKYFAAASRQDLEGVMAKRKDSPYVSGARTKDWLKVKTSKRQEAIIVGYTEPKKSRKYFGSLVFAICEKGSYKYVGHVGTGFSSKGLKELFELMQPLVRKTKPITNKVPVEDTITWLTPKLIGEVKFTEWTPDHQMRHPVFMGLRSDKKPEDVSIEKEVPATVAVKEKGSAGEKAGKKGSELSFTHTDKVYFPNDGYTKGDLLAYYASMADVILPYVKDRPMVLNRHPNGINKPSFFQKDSATGNLPDFVRTTVVHSESTDADINYIVCDNKETLLYIANLGTIELNPWNSRIPKLDKPDYYVIDLDPGDNTFEQVIEVAKVVHEILDMSCEKSYVKTSGKTGIHIYVPLKAKYHYDQVRQFSELVVRLVHQRMPDITSLERSPAKRKDKIYLDYLQNRVGQTLASPYSVRPVDGACVSAPLEWKEVRKGLRPDKFTIKTIGKRLKEKGDLWEGILEDSVNLTEALKCLEKELKK